MLPPEAVYEEAKKKEDENLKFRTFLKMYADEKELDKQFLRLHNEIFPQYDCSKCRNCCKKYSIEIPKKDLEKDAKHMGQLKAGFIMLYLDYDKKENKYYARNYKGECAFLEANGNCALGSCKPANCKEYPFTNQPDRMGSLLSILESVEICPVVFEIYERLKNEYGFVEGGSISKSAKKSMIKSARDFLEYHDLELESIAGIEYVLWRSREELKELDAELDEYIELNAAEHMEHMEMINAAETKEEYFKLMRTPMDERNRIDLREKILEHEDIMLPYIKKKAICSGQDIFIENALNFFLSCKEDCCDWIMEEYSNIRSEYMKSMLCMALGVRGDERWIPFLQDEAMRFECTYPDEDLDQGPLIGLAALLNRLEEKNRRYFA